MLEETQFKKIFKSKMDLLTVTLSAKLSHSVEKGDESEIAWIEFFREVLPHRFNVAKGFVFDSKGNVSEQLDIIIYDALYSPIIARQANGSIYITVESVYAVFEVKQIINKAMFEYTVKKVESVRKLKRTSAKIFNAGVKIPPRDLTHIIGGILSLESVKTKRIEELLTQYPEIDIGCSIEKNAFVSYEDESNNIFYHSLSEQDVLISFYFMILKMLFMQGTVAAIDLDEYSTFFLPNLDL